MTENHEFKLPSIVLTSEKRAQEPFLVGGLEHFSPCIGNVIIPIDSYFSEGLKLNHQPDILTPDHPGAGDRAT